MDRRVEGEKPRHRAEEPDPLLDFPDAPTFLRGRVRAVRGLPWRVWAGLVVFAFIAITSAVEGDLGALASALGGLGMFLVWFVLAPLVFLVLRHGWRAWRHRKP